MISTSPGRSRLSARPAAAASEAVNHRTVVGRHRRATTRARIVEAAMRVYAEKGPDLPVIDDFVKAAGMSRGTFYNHFTTTTELLEATIECYSNELARAIVEVIEPLDDLVEKAAIAMRIHLQWITCDPRVCAFFAKVPQLGEFGRRYARGQMEQGIASGVLQVPDVDAACDLMFGALSEAVRRIARFPRKPKRCNEVVTIVLIALGVQTEKIREVMARPLPELRLPVRPN